jgi:CIC family chloride channel protein
MRILQNSYYWCNVQLLKLKVHLTPKQFILIAAVLVGLSAGLVSVVLKVMAHEIYHFALIRTDGSSWFYAMLPFFGILTTAILIRYLFKGNFKKGLGHLHENIARKSGIMGRRSMFDQVLTSSITVGLGGSTGLEAPLVLTGASFGSNFAQTYRLSVKDRFLLIACGIAAGIASAFNAPIAGVLFASEVLLIDFSINALVPVIISAASGALVSKVLLNQGVILNFKEVSDFNYWNVPFYVVLALLTGLFAVYHVRVFPRVEHFFSHRMQSFWPRTMIAGLLVSLMIFTLPPLFGEGYQFIVELASGHGELLFKNSWISSFLDNHWLFLFAILGMIFIKSFATAITLGGGGNGGNFAPSLFIGAYLGFLVSDFINTISKLDLPVANFTMVGMSGLLAGIYHAPLTAIFLIAELTSGYSLIIPLMIVSSISFVISKYFEPYGMDLKPLVTKKTATSGDRDFTLLIQLNLKDVTDTTFTLIPTTMLISDFIPLVARSMDPFYPVVDEHGSFEGFVVVDEIRSLLMNQDFDHTMAISSIMSMPSIIINTSHTFIDVMHLFDKSELIFLPVVENGTFIGYTSRVKVYNAYREKIKEQNLD